MKDIGRISVIGDVVVETHRLHSDLWETEIRTPDYTAWQLSIGRRDAMDSHGKERWFHRRLRKADNGPAPLRFKWRKK